MDRLYISGSGCFPFCSRGFVLFGGGGRRLGTGSEGFPADAIYFGRREAAKENARHLLKRDDAAFFPVEEAFVDEGVLYWVFRPLAGNLLAHRLIQSGSLPPEEVRKVLSAIFGHARRLASKGEYAVVDPLNILGDDGRERPLFIRGSGRQPTRYCHSGCGKAVGIRHRLPGIPVADRSIAAGGSCVPPLRRYRSDLPAAWDGPIRQALSSDPASRPTLVRLEAGLLKAPEEGGDVPQEERPAPAKPAEKSIRRAERDSLLPAAPGDTARKGADGRPAVKPSPVGAAEGSAAWRRPGGGLQPRVQEKRRKPAWSPRGKRSPYPVPGGIPDRRGALQEFPSSLEIQGAGGGAGGVRRGARRAGRLSMALRRRGPRRCKTFRGF